MSWKPLGAVLPGTLAEARVELHWAAQLVSAAGTCLLSATDDFSHTNLSWLKGLGVLAGRPVGESSLRAALVFEALELVVLDGERERGSLRLAGHTIEDAIGWLTEALGAPEGSLSLPQHDMPDHAVGRGVAFSGAHADPRRELAAWFDDASRVIGAIVADEDDAAPVRVWPHHFDVASLLTFDEAADPETARSIGIGFSPGDGSYDQPYFYANPWPYPDASKLPALEAGAHWHTEGWTGAVVKAEAVISVSHGRQHDYIANALEEAVEAGRRLLAV
ncbi:MAG: hypothetical protein AAF500_13905 [Myxococcota bacterium]